MGCLAVIVNIYYYYTHNNKAACQTIHNYKNYYEEMGPKDKDVD